MNNAVGPQAVLARAELLTVDTSGTQRSTVSDDIGSHLTCDAAMRAVCLSWLLPAVWLTWTGFGSLGVRAVDGAASAMALHRIQAIAILLTIFGSLIGAIWATRSWGRVLPLRQLAVLAVVVGWQLTVGWAHLVDPTGWFSPLLVVEGLALAWASVAAARVIGPETVPLAEPSTLDERLAAAAESELVSQAPVRPSLPEPAVGR